MPMHSNLKLGYSSARQKYMVLVYHDSRYGPSPTAIYFDTREERQQFIKDYYPPEPSPSPEPSPPAPSEPSEPTEPSENGDNGQEPTPPAVTASYGLLMLVSLILVVAYLLSR